MEDYTWESESDVLGCDDEEGANELVEEHFKRLEYLKSTRAPAPSPLSIPNR